jgi:hypothetical protein
MAARRRRPVKVVAPSRSSDADDVLLGEVAEALGIARSTAWARVLRGIIPAEWVGGRYIVQRETLDRLVAEANS